MATILKGHSKAKFSKLVTSKLRISKGTWWTLRPPWFFVQILSTMMAPLYGHGDAEEHLKKQLFGALHPSKLSLRRVNSLKGLGNMDEPFSMERRENQWMIQSQVCPCFEFIRSKHLKPWLLPMNKNLNFSMSHGFRKHKNYYIDIFGVLLCLFEAWHA